MRFKKYIKRWIKYDTREGWFAQDVLSDKYFPWQICSTEKYYSRIKDYLHNSGASRSAIEAFEEIWRDYLSNF